MYGGGSDSNGDIRGSGMACDLWAKRTNPMLDSASDSYSDSEISVGDSGPSSYSIYTIY